MTLKTSLFNLGIYKNTLHRFKWGSFLYFIILFFSTPFVFMTQPPSKWLLDYESHRMFNQSGLLLKQSFMVIPYLLALTIPTVVALLVFHNVHSSKQGIFTHSIPVTRKTYYISALSGGFSLMAIPVLLNGIILLVMSLFGYGQVFEPWSVGCWIMINLTVLFIMFSVSSFSAFLTGNGVAHVVINVLLHTFSLLIAGAIVLVSEIFLFGFARTSDSFIAEQIFSNTPLVWLFTRLVQEWSFDLNMFKTLNLWIYFIGSAVLYVLGYFLYKNRKIEACGDVAAFKVFRPILKYTVTAATALAALSMLWAMNLPAIAIFIVAAAVSAIVYFICEMLMAKTFKVFGTYKGFAVFAACSAAIIAFCAYTSIFGYETRIPESDKVEKAAIFIGYYGSDEAPLVTDENAINAVREFHKEAIKDIYITERSFFNKIDYNTPTIRIKYALKNGKNLERRYYVKQELFEATMSKMYEYSEYKMKLTRLDQINIDNIRNATLSVYSSGYSYHIALNENASELIEAYKKDIEALGYKEMSGEAHIVEFNVSLSLTASENAVQKVFKEGVFSPNANGHEVQSVDFSINSHFTNAMALLKEKGYYDEIKSGLAASLWICKNPLFKSGGICTYKGDKGDFHEFYASSADCVQLTEVDADKMAEDMINSHINRRSPDNGKYYFLFQISRNAVESTIWFANNGACFEAEELPEYLKKYVEE